MSTKIYNAYRVPKSVDLRDLLNRMKSASTEALAKDHDYLYLLHALSVAKAAQKVESGSSDYRAKDTLKENEENKFGFTSLFWLEHCCKEAAMDHQQNLMAIEFSMSLWPDEEHWYIKFFVNWCGFNQKMMNAVLEACPELEDFHYQNQTDPPDDIPYEEFEKRDQKWEELTKPNGNYRNMLQFIVFDHNDLSELIRKYWWTGEQDLYKHLAYKFDKKVLKEKGDEEGETKTTEEIENNNE